jgi:transcriptional regulator with GAF, ATPase, and Fis domain
VKAVGKRDNGKSKITLAHEAVKPFIPVNVASLSENLIESELFGHEKGSFTWR